MLVLTAGVCTAVLTTQARNRILNLTYQNAEQKQQALVRSFSNMLLYYHEEQDSAAATRSLAKYCFTQYADSEAVLMLSGETVYSALSFDPSEYLTLEGGTPQRCTGTADGRELLIVGSSERLPYSFANNPDGTGCTVYIVQDITPVYEQMRTLTFQFAAIGAVCIGLGLLLIALLVRRFLSPLQELQNAAAHIAAGSYEERVTVSSADEVGALARDFNAMAGAVEQRIEELTETAERQRLFIGGVTHEFKTPLTALLLNVDSPAKHLSGRGGAQRRHSADRASDPLAGAAGAEAPKAHYAGAGTGTADFFCPGASGAREGEHRGCAHAARSDASNGMPC